MSAGTSGQSGRPEDPVGLRGSTVVVGFEPAEDECSAILLGRRLAAATGGPLRLVVAVRDRLADVVAVRAGIDAEGLHRAWIDRARSDLRRAVATHFDEAFVSAHESMRLGPPERVLATAADEHDAAVVVVPGGNAERRSAWLRHGTVGALLRQTDVPILVAGPGATRLERVVIAMDATEAARPTVAWGMALASSLGLEVEIVHVLAPEVAELLMDRGAESPGGAAASVQRRLDEFVGDRPARIVSGHPADRLARIAAEHRGTLMVLGRHAYGRMKRWIVGSTTSELLARLPSSLLVVPVPTAEHPQGLSAADGGHAGAST